MTAKSKLAVIINYSVVLSLFIMIFNFGYLVFTFEHIKHEVTKKDKIVCADYGFREGTTQFANCRMQLDNMRKQDNKP